MTAQVRARTGRCAKRIQASLSEKVFDGITYTLLALFGICIVIPFMNVLSMSVSDELAIVSNRVTVFPVGFSLSSYQSVFRSNSKRSGKGKQQQSTKWNSSTITKILSLQEYCGDIKALEMRLFSL